MRVNSIYWLELGSDLAGISVRDSVVFDFFNQKKYPSMNLISSNDINWLYRKFPSKLIDVKRKKIHLFKRFHLANNDVVEIQWICFQNKKKDSNCESIFFLGLVNRDKIMSECLRWSNLDGELDSKGKIEFENKFITNRNLDSMINELITLCNLIDYGFPDSDALFLYKEWLLNSVVSLLIGSTSTFHS